MGIHSVLAQLSSARPPRQYVSLMRRQMGSSPVMSTMSSGGYGTGYGTSYGAGYGTKYSLSLAARSLSLTFLIFFLFIFITFTLSMRMFMVLLEFNKCYGFISRCKFTFIIGFLTSKHFFNISNLLSFHLIWEFDLEIDK